jgi:hypothetical protein
LRWLLLLLPLLRGLALRLLLGATTGCANAPARAARTTLVALRGDPCVIVVQLGARELAAMLLKKLGLLLEREFARAICVVK